MNISAIQLSCCGIREINGLSRASARELLIDFGELMYGPYYEYGNGNFRYVIFSEAYTITPTTPGYGEKFANLIQEIGAGDVIRTGWNLNPNSGNYVRVYTWTVNHDVVTKWWKEHGPKLKEEKAKKMQSMYAQVSNDLGRDQRPRAGVPANAEYIPPPLIQHAPLIQHVVPQPPRDDGAEVGCDG